MRHVVLLGDSTLDNAAYVAGGRDVASHLGDALPEGWEATLAARDGAVMADVGHQLLDLPAKASHLVLSVGGNDALRRSGVLDEPARSVAEVLEAVTGIADDFEAAYQAMLSGVLAKALPTIVCTIYDVRFPEPRQRRLAKTALAVLNDRITRQAFANGLPLIDLRLVCDDDEDFANPIEPSDRGGAKIAAAIAAAVSQHDPALERPVVYAR